MKPFNLKDALAGKPVVTRSGLVVRYIAEIPANVEYPIAGVVDSLTTIRTWTVDGEYAVVESPLDLFMASIKKKGYINIYPQTEYNRIGKTMHDTTNILYTEQDARDHAKVYPGLIAVAVPVEWEE